MNKVKKGATYIVAYTIFYVFPISTLYIALMYIPIALILIPSICIIGLLYLFIDFLIIFKDCEDISDFFKATGCLTLVVLLGLLLPYVVKGLFL